MAGCIRSAPLFLLLLGGCGLFIGDHKAYEGNVRPDTEIATIDSSGKILNGERTWALRRVESGGQVFYDRSRDGVTNEVKLAPGAYVVTYSYKHGATSGKGYMENVNLAAGHTYEIMTDVCYVFCSDMPSYETFLWIEDIATGQVVSGNAP